MQETHKRLGDGEDVRWEVVFLGEVLLWGRWWRLPACDPTAWPLWPCFQWPVCVCCFSGQYCHSDMDSSLPGFSVHGILQARILGCHSFLQGIFQTQGWNLDLLHCRQTLNCLSHQGNPNANLISFFGLWNGDFWKMLEPSVSLCFKIVVWGQVLHCMCAQHESSSPWVLRCPERQDSSLFSILRERL